MEDIMGTSAGKKGKIIIIVIVALVLIAAGVVTFILLSSGEKGYRTIGVQDIVGDVTVEYNGQVYKAYPDMHLSDGFAMTTALASFSRLNLDQEKFAKLEEKSRAKFEAMGSGGRSTSIVLEYGTLTNEVTRPLNPGEEYKVTTPNAVLSIKGTFFIARARQDANGKWYTDVYTFSGTVVSHRILPDGTPINEAVPIDAGYKTTIYMDDENTIYIQDVDDNPDDNVDPIDLDEIGDDILIDVYATLLYGQKSCYTPEQIKDVLDKRGVDLSKHNSYLTGEPLSDVPTGQTATTTSEITTPAGTTTTPEVTTVSNDDTTVPPATTTTVTTEATTTTSEATTTTTAAATTTTAATTAPKTTSTTSPTTTPPETTTKKTKATTTTPETTTATVTTTEATTTTPEETTTPETTTTASTPDVTTTTTTPYIPSYYPPSDPPYSSEETTIVETTPTETSTTECSHVYASTASIVSVNTSAGMEALSAILRCTKCSHTLPVSLSGTSFSFFENSDGSIEVSFSYGGKSYSGKYTPPASTSDVCDHPDGFRQEDETLATCTNKGKVRLYCTKCGETLSESELPIDPDAHSWGTPTFNENVESCTAVFTCSNGCGATHSVSCTRQTQTVGDSTETWWSCEFNGTTYETVHRATS
jgi:hypothetical protein